MSVETLIPGITVQSTSVHGRPFTVSRLTDTVTTAYLHVTAPGMADSRLLVQNLRLHTHRAGAITAFVDVPYPADEHVIPELGPDGEYTARGCVDGHSYTFGAKLAANQLVAAAIGVRQGPVFSPTTVPHIDGSQVAKLSVTEEGLMIELRSRNVEMRSPRT